MKTYTLANVLKFFTLPAALVMTSYIFVELVMRIVTGQHIGKRLGGILAIFLWYRFLTSPYKIIIYENDNIEFRRLFNSFTINAADVLSVKEDPISSGMYVIHPNGKVKISSLFDNLTELKGIIRSFAKRNIV